METEHDLAAALVDVMHARLAAAADGGGEVDVLGRERVVGDIREAFVGGAHHIHDW